MATADLDVIRALEESYGRQGLPQTGSSLPAPSLRKAQDTIELGLFIYHRLQAHSRSWVTEIEQGVAEFSWQDSQTFSDAFASWLESSKAILAVIQKQAYVDKLLSLDEFRSAVRDVSLMSLDTQRVKESIESLESHKGRSFEQGIEELRNRLR
jgi:phage-related protein